MLGTSAFAAENESNDPNSKENDGKATTDVVGVSTNEDGSKTEENSDISGNAAKNESPALKTEAASNYNSSCKFNFIFYFIYKVKYDENGEMGENPITFEF